MRNLHCLVHRSALVAVLATLIGVSASAQSSDRDADGIRSSLLSEINARNQSILLGATIVGSWNCTGTGMFADFRFLVTYNAGGTFGISVSDRTFSDTHGVWERRGLTTFATTEKGFLYDANGIADRIQSVDGALRLKSPTDLEITLNGVVNRIADGAVVFTFPTVVNCKRILVN